MRRALLTAVSAAALTFLLAREAGAQSSPGWSFGYVPTAAQWNAAFAAKQDYTGVVPLNITGGTMLGELTTSIATANGAGFNIPPTTVAPSSPNNGDIWTTSAGIFVQINGSTVQLASGTQTILGNNNIWSGTNQFNLATTLNGTTTVNATLTVNGTSTFTGFLLNNFNSASIPSTGSGVAISANQSSGNNETDFWNTGTGAIVSFLFKQVNGAGTFKNLVDLSLGTTTGGIVDIYGFTSGKITLQTGSAAAGTWNWNWPLTAGGAGQLLTSQGGTGAMTWSTAGAGTVTSAQINATAGVTATGTCTITVQGTCTIGSYSAPPGGRLTLLSGVPVMAALSNNGTAGAQTLYYAPYVGSTVPVYNGTSFISYQFTSGASDIVGQSLSLAGGSAWAKNTVFDVFDTLNGTALTLCTGPAWSTTNSRGTAGGIGLTIFDGIHTNTGTMTCRTGTGTTITVNANQGTYLGSIMTDTGVNGQITFTTGSIGSCGSASVQNVFNYNNRTVTTAVVQDNEASYTYTSSTIREHGACTSMIVKWLSGAAEDTASFGSQNDVTLVANAGAFVHFGSSLNSTIGFLILPTVIQNPVSSAGVASALAHSLIVAPQLGSSTVALLESGDGTNANTFNAGTNDVLQGMIRN
jgi:hypothetical protein